MNVCDQNTMSEESEDDGPGESREEMTYRRKYQMLLERCEVLQQDNERLVHRIQEVYKCTRQVRKERKFLMDRLDNYGDNWRQGITQYIYNDNIHGGKPPSKTKQHSLGGISGEKHAKKSNFSNKRISKDKTDSDLLNRKQMKDSTSNSSSGKNCPKNLSAW